MDLDIFKKFFNAFGFIYFFSCFSFKLTSILLPSVSEMSVQVVEQVSSLICEEPSDYFLTACSYPDTQAQ